MVDGFFGHDLLPQVVPVDMTPFDGVEKVPFHEVLFDKIFLQGAENLRQGKA